MTIAISMLTGCVMCGSPMIKLSITLVGQIVVIQATSAIFVWLIIKLNISSGTRIVSMLVNPAVLVSMVFNVNVLCAILMPAGPGMFTTNMTFTDLIGLTPAT